jgi:hypothetical protein
MVSLKGHWTPRKSKIIVLSIETRRVIEGKTVNRIKAIKELTAMKVFRKHL